MSSARRLPSLRLKMRSSSAACRVFSTFGALSLRFRRILLMSPAFPSFLPPRIQRSYSRKSVAAAVASRPRPARPGAAGPPTACAPLGARFPSIGVINQAAATRGAFNAAAFIRRCWSCLCSVSQSSGLQPMYVLTGTRRRAARAAGRSSSRWTANHNGSPWAGSRRPALLSKTRSRLSWLFTLATPCFRPHINGVPSPRASPRWMSRVPGPAPSHLRRQGPPKSCHSRNYVPVFLHFCDNRFVTQPNPSD